MKKFKLSLVIMIMAMLVLPGGQNWAVAAEETINTGAETLIAGELTDETEVEREKVQLTLEGKPIYLYPSAQVENGQIMVPGKIFAELQPVYSDISWNDKLNKITLVHQGNMWEFVMGEERAWVNGEAKRLETAPYIDDDFSFLPLEFIITGMGNTLSWDKERNVADITIMTSAHRIFAYYYKSPLEELEQNAHLFTDIAFRWLLAGPKGEITYEYKDDYAEKVQWAKDKGIKTHVSIALMNEDYLDYLLESPRNRMYLISRLLLEMKKYDYDGINIDFEYIAADNAHLFTQFLQDLRTNMDPDKHLSVAVFGRTSQDKWATPYEYRKIGRIVDEVVVMSYDYDFRPNTPGPIAPLWWVEDTAKYMLANIPREKIFMGLATYGYDWPQGGKGVTISAERLEELRENSEIKEYFDIGSMSPYYICQEEDGLLHTIWMENERSLNYKVDMINKYQLGGLTFWRIGTGFDDLYNVLGQYHTEDEAADAAKPETESDNGKQAGDKETANG